MGKWEIKLYNGTSYIIPGNFMNVVDNIMEKVYKKEFSLIDIKSVVNMH